MESTICPNCGGPVAQTGRGRPRRFCSPKCGIKFANDQKPRKYGNQAGFDATRHMLTNLDLEARTADCSQCGPGTTVYSCGRGTERFQCSKRLKAQKRRPHNVRSNRESSWRKQGIKLTVEQYDQMVQDQLGRCPCGEELRHPHVHHNHETGEVRGILCRECNRAFGLLSDDPARLQGLASYLSH